MSDKMYNCQMRKPKDDFGFSNPTQNNSQGQYWFFHVKMYGILNLYPGDQLSEEPTPFSSHFQHLGVLRRIL